MPPAVAPASLSHTLRPSRGALLRSTSTLGLVPRHRVRLDEHGDYPALRVHERTMHPDQPRTPKPESASSHLEFPGGSDDFGLAPRPRANTGTGTGNGKAESKSKSKARRVDPLLGVDLGGVTITRLVGEGGMGRVYEAQQASPQRTVAVKIIRFGLTSEKTLRRFEREAEFLGKLQHPGIAQIHMAGTYESDFGDVPFFVMEYVANGKPITNFAHENDLTLTDRLKLFKQVCEAVAHGHDRGIVHRDLKPGNILISAHGKPKVIDFGVARSTDSDLTLTKMKTDTGALVGTVQHMAPEQFGDNAGKIDARADVYSLGVVLYELLAGGLPYEISKKAMHEAARIVCEEIPRPLKSRDKAIPREVSMIAERCLQKSRWSRYHNAGELAADIGRFLDGKPLSARTASLFSRSWRSLGRLLRRKWLVVPLVALLGLIGGIALVRTGSQLSDGFGDDWKKPGLRQAVDAGVPASFAQAQVPVPPAPHAKPLAEKPGPEEPVGSVVALSDEAAAIVTGVTKTLKEQFAACNEENIGRLRATYSAEHPYQNRDFGDIQSCWNTNDTYCRLDRVELLADSDAPRAKFEPPYATVRVTQTVIELPPSDERNEVFHRRCRQDDTDLLKIADRLGYRNRLMVTTSVELLFKQEDGDWKFVTALTAPVAADGNADTGFGLGVGVPFQIKVRQSRSVFN